MRRERESPSALCQDAVEPLALFGGGDVQCVKSDPVGHESANDKYGSSLDRTLGASKPVDPATRLSELFAQSLEELTRPFDPPRPGRRPPGAAPSRGEPASSAEAAHEQPAEPRPNRRPEQYRLDADKALAELEAELFAAAKQVDREDPHHGYASRTPASPRHASRRRRSSRTAASRSRCRRAGRATNAE